MINGGHIMIYSKDAERDREVFKTVLNFPHVDAGHGFLIFKLPPSELAVHEADENDVHQLYLMTDDLDMEISRLKKAGIKCEPASTQRWGITTQIHLPGGGKLGLYQPRHERP